MLSHDMMRHLQVMLEMGAEQDGSPAAVQLERLVPLYFEVRGCVSTRVQWFARNPSCMRRRMEPLLEHLVCRTALI